VQALAWDGPGGLCRFGVAREGYDATYLFDETPLGPANPKKSGRKDVLPAQSVGTLIY
jgi:hypothetical protein